mmetsp:Transcript_29760/g.79087  ORF Transcript_29760/g.79087 Transcript_29760/m.79087 type:complete len:382 (-) Transcript_29760:41-1186(-)
MFLQVEALAKAFRPHTKVDLIELKDLNATAEQKLGAEGEEELIKQMKQEVRWVAARGLHLHAVCHVDGVQVAHVGEEAHAYLLEALGQGAPPGMQDHVGGVVQVFILANICFMHGHISTLLQLVSSSQRPSEGICGRWSVIRSTCARMLSHPSVPCRQRRHREPVNLHSLGSAQSVMLQQRTQLPTGTANFLRCPTNDHMRRGPLLWAVQLCADLHLPSEGLQVTSEACVPRSVQALPASSAERHPHNATMLQHLICKALFAWAPRCAVGHHVSEFIGVQNDKGRAVTKLRLEGSLETFGGQAQQCLALDGHDDGTHTKLRCLTRSVVHSIHHIPEVCGVQVETSACVGVDTQCAGAQALPVLTRETRRKPRRDSVRHAER